MPGNPVKFRCYRCHQLLGISRAKIGMVSSCPKCRAALVVPAPDATPAVPGTPTARGSEPTLAFLSGFPSGSVDSILDIRPEDIRVEPGIVFTPPPRPVEAPPPIAEPPASPVHPKLEAVAAVPDPAEAQEPSRTTEPPTVAALDLLPAVETVAPPIEVDGPRRAGARPAVVTRAPDVVLPRSVVVAWSLFVLLALALAFGAGLFAGHYIWRVH